MLPRVSAALAQFIAPIATSGTKTALQQSTTERKQGVFKRFTKDRSPEQQGQRHEEPREQAKPEGNLAKVIPLPLKESDSGTVAKTEGAAAPPAIVTQSLLQLMTLLQDQRASIMRWLGESAYRKAERVQKKNGRCRKGTIVDERVE